MPPGTAEKIPRQTDGKNLAAATGLISSAPTPGYGKRFEDVTAADVAEWRRIFGEDFVQLQLSQEGRRRLLVSAGKRLPSLARLRVFTPIALCCRSARRANSARWG